MKRNKKMYAIYDNDGLIICVGTASECSHFLNIDITTFYSKLSLIRKKRVKKSKYEIYEIGNENEYN